MDIVARLADDGPLVLAFCEWDHKKYQNVNI